MGGSDQHGHLLRLMYELDAGGAGLLRPGFAKGGERPAEGVDEEQPPQYAGWVGKDHGDGQDHYENDEERYATFEVQLLETVVAHVADHHDGRKGGYDGGGHRHDRPAAFDLE